MFEIKQHIYKVEYEGLHFLCRNCGKFGHYMEGCPVKINGGREEVHTDPHPNVSPGKHGNVSEAREGPWMVVQKPKWQKRGKETVSTVAAGGGRVLPASFRAATTAVGSRFGILGSDPNNPEALIGHDGDSGVLAEIEGNSHGICASGKDGVINSIVDTRGKNKGKKTGSHAKIRKNNNKTQVAPQVNVAVKKVAPQIQVVSNAAPIINSNSNSNKGTHTELVI